jgi:hypothetical protein
MGIFDAMCPRWIRIGVLLTRMIRDNSGITFSLVLIMIDVRSASISHKSLPF